MARIKSSVDFKAPSSTMPESNEALNYFLLLLEKEPVSKYTTATLALIMIIVLVPVLYSIIWYEKFGSNKRKTIINYFLSSICWNLIIWLLTVQMVAVTRAIYGPLNHYVCLGTFILRRALATNILLLLDAISLVRYLFIFWLKNVTAFNDDFWFRLVLAWIYLFSILLHIICAFLPNQKMLVTNVCTGEASKPASGAHSSLFGIEAPTLLLQAIVLTRIWLYKKKTKQQIPALPNSVNEIEKSSIINSTANILFVTLIVATFGLGVFGSFLPPEKLIVLPYSWLYHFVGLLLPCCITVCFTFALFARNRDMRSCIVREIRDLFWRAKEATEQRKKANKVSQSVKQVSEVR